MPKKPKVKVNINKPAKRPIVNIQYFKVYNEVLKFEEVMDIDLDRICEVIIDVMTDAAMESKLGDAPTTEQIEVLVAKIVDILKDEPEPESQEADYSLNVEEEKAIDYELEQFQVDPMVGIRR